MKQHVGKWCNLFLCRTELVVYEVNGREEIQKVNWSSGSVTLYHGIIITGCDQTWENPGGEASRMLVHRVPTNHLGRLVMSLGPPNRVLPPPKPAPNRGLKGRNPG